MFTLDCLLQVTAQLLSADGRVAATVSKPWVMRPRSWTAKFIRQAAPNSPVAG